MRTSLFFLLLISANVVGCASHRFRADVGLMRSAVNIYCDLTPGELREAYRAAVNAAIAPRAIHVTCAAEESP